LRGIDSHGIARLPIYVRHLKSGRFNPRPNIQVLRETPSTATVDGDGGMGLVVGPKANEIAQDKAGHIGTGWVAVCNSHHFGIAGYYVLQSLERDMIGWAMTNGTTQVAPLWGIERMLGTNPIAIAFPGKEEPPIVVDMATSVVAYGKIEQARRRNEPIPEGWALDSSGNMCTDPDALGADYSVLPLGSDRQHGGHKGYCLATLVDLLTGVLSGANWGPFVPPFIDRPDVPHESVGKGIGHFFGAMRIDAFVEPDEFKQRVDQWVQTFRAAKPAPKTNGPLIPGDPERIAEDDRGRNGIPLIRAVTEELRQIANDLQIEFLHEDVR
jgi:LDH2 family malate/lactate/ureidoglycolate dehydrogenase